VPVYSSDYATADRTDYPTRQSYRSRVDGVYMGHKWQCVELARRWLYVNKGCVFDDISMAYDIFRLRHVRVVRDGTLLPLKSFRNGSKRLPEPGALLIWNEGGEFDVTGHVAVVTELLADRVRCIEQSVDHHHQERSAAAAHRPRRGISRRPGLTAATVS
jgi:glutathionylspermidine amidase/synthetase